MTSDLSSRSINPWVALLIAISGCLSLGALSGLLSGSGPSPWYDSLERSMLTPSSWVFGVVWPALYTLMGISAWLVWRIPDQPARNNALGLFAVQLAVNLAWSPIFFGAHMIGASVIIILVLLVLLGLTIWRFYALSPIAATLLLPYLAWSGFAFYLATVIWLKN